MNYKDLMVNIVPSEDIIASKDFEVRGLSNNSKDVREGFIFFALKGFKSDGKNGNDYISESLKNGAKGIVTGIEPDENLKKILSENNVSLVVTKSPRKVMAMTASKYFGYPSEKLVNIALTGTNGKTTTVSIIKFVLEAAGLKCGLIGTIDYLIGGRKIESKLTTPDSIEIQSLMNDMVNAGLSYCVLEASSIALLLDRLYGINFKLAAFTNLTSEHLDLHDNMENYFEAKKILFDSLKQDSVAVSNKDDDFGMRILKDTEAKKIFYGLRNDADFKCINESLSLNGLEFDLKYADGNYRIKSKLTGRFNLYNILTAISVLVSLGIDLDSIISSIEKFEPVKGRFNNIPLPNGAYAVIDYSHTSDSLKNAIESAVELRNNRKKAARVITIFGCGGNKDKTKRPVMGNFATSLSDYAIITSDNPRFEEPGEIISEILTGIKERANYEIEVDREEAIRKGIEMSGEGDIILICGKGHETYQEIKGVRSHFDDKEIVDKYSNLAKAK